MTGDRLDALRAEVARHAGPARARPLTELGRELANAYWRAGPGQPVAVALLDEAIAVLDEAAGHLDVGQAPWIRTSATAGWLIGTRHIAHGSGAEDRENGIRCLDDALRRESFLPPVQAAMSHLVLGQLLMSRPLARLSAGGLDPAVLMAAAPPAEAADTERAIACFRRVVGDPSVPAQARDMAATLLEMAGILRDLTAGGMDLGRLMRAVQAMSRMQEQAAARPSGTGFGHRTNPFEFVADEIARQDPLERPVSAVIEAEPAAPIPDPDPDPPSRPGPRRSAAELRRAFHDAVPGRASEPVCALLADDAPDPDVDTVDRMVARAEALVAAPDADDADRLLHAVALYRRGLVDGDGWGDGGDPADLGAAAESLLAAGLVRAPATTVATALRLAGLLDGRSPALAVLDRIGAQFRDIGDVLRRAGVLGLYYPAAERPLLYDVSAGGFRPADPARLPARVVVAGDAPLPETDAVVSVVRTAAQAAELAGRRRRPPGDAAVFVGNPRLDREHASVETMLLRRTFYPRSVGLGQTVEGSDGAGTPAEVRARLDASMLHLACGITAAGDLELAGPAVLGVAEIAAATGAGDGGVAVLPASPTGAGPLVDALLSAGFAGVVAFRTALPGDVACLVHVLLHAELVDRGTDPANAVARVRRWLRDPNRALPDYLPTWYHTMAAGADVTDPGVAGAVVHHGI